MDLHQGLERAYPGAGAVEVVIFRGDRRGDEAGALGCPLETIVDLHPETPPFSRVDLAVALNAAAAGAIDHLLGAVGLVAEKTGGVEGTVAAHPAAVHRSQ